MTRLILRLLLTLPLVFLLACASNESRDWVELRGHKFWVEVANDSLSRERGLMFREKLDDDSGMLFIHDQIEPQAYWMKNTRISLDILYFDANRILVNAHENVPPCSGGNRCPVYASAAPILFVLELNAGKSREIGLEKGDQLTLGSGVLRNK